MNHTQQIIQDAIEGGWRWIDMERYLDARIVMNDYDFNFSKELLDPLFWQAVGKTRGWVDDDWNKPVDWFNNVQG